MNTMHERPGVYLDEEGSGLIWSTGGRAVGIVGEAQKGTVNQLYTVSYPSDAQTLFGECTLSALCAAALQNGAARVLAVPAGEDYDKAFALLEEEDICVLVSGSLVETDGRKLVESVEKSANAGFERLGALACPVENPVSWVENLKSDRLLVTVQSGVDENGESVPEAAAAAALAGRVAQFTSGEGTANGAVLYGFSGLNRSLSEDEIDELVRAGVTPLEVLDGAVRVIRAVVTQKEGGFYELFTRLAVDQTISAVRSALKAMLPGRKNTAASRSALAAQAAVVLERQRRAGWLESFATPRVTAHETDPSMCVAQVSFTVAQGLNRILLSVSIHV